MHTISYTPPWPRHPPYSEIVYVRAIQFKRERDKSEINKQIDKIHSFIFKTLTQQIFEFIKFLISKINKIREVPTAKKHVSINVTMFAISRKMRVVSGKDRSFCCAQKEPKRRSTQQVDLQMKNQTSNTHQETVNNPVR